MILWKAIPLAAAILLSCQAASSVVPRGESHRVLFIGNSLTYQNDLPGTLTALAKSAGDVIETEMAAEANFALIDHVMGGSNAISLIRRGGWQYVVLQQGPTSQGPGVDVDTLILATRLLDKEIRAVGARTALYMVWPTSTRLAFFDNVLAAYKGAADAVTGAFFPVGEGWRTAWRADASLPLYASDGFHPSELGTYLAALVMYEAITGKDARALPLHPTVGGHSLATSDATVRLLQAAAHETNLRFAR